MNGSFIMAILGFYVGRYHFAWFGKHGLFFAWREYTFHFMYIFEATLLPLCNYLVYRRSIQWFHLTLLRNTSGVYSNISLSIYHCRLNCHQGHQNSPSAILLNFAHSTFNLPFSTSTPLIPPPSKNPAPTIAKGQSRP